MDDNRVDPEWDIYIKRYIKGEWRSPIFRDMILADAKKLSRDQKGLHLLDIGCGNGFDNDVMHQCAFAKVAEQYIGVEPDQNIDIDGIFSRTYRCCFEDAILNYNSIDLAFAFMVLEHLENPSIFWAKLHKILRHGGVFWGFTVDVRHWFALVSIMADKLHIKETYLNRIHGKRGEERYETYGTFYRSNTPKQIKSMTQMFSSVTILNFYRCGQTDYYIPEQLRWLSRAFDRFAIKMGWPGSLMAVRVVK